jgi:hypothetical protein
VAVGVALSMYRLQRVVVVLVAATVNGVSADFVDKFDVCKGNVQGIMNGSIIMGDINNVTIRQPERGLMFTGTPKELAKDYPREQYITLTYKGKQVMNFSSKRSSLS